MAEDVLEPLKPPSVPRLIVGLGNPGAEYRDTRHNIGFGVVELLAEQWKARWEACRDWHGALGKMDGRMLLKPSTFMNRSGESVSAVAGFFKIAPEEILVVLDDVALPLGRLRLRESGSAGGHNGLRSILERAGTQRVPRLRVGIGPSKGDGQLVGHVLGRFAKGEKEEAQRAVVRAAEAVQCVLDRTLSVAMNIYNQTDTDNQ